MKSYKRDHDITEQLRKDIAPPHIVNNSLNQLYDKIRSDEVHMKNLKRKTHRAVWGAAAAACIVLTLASMFYVNPALAKDIPLIGNLFGTLEKMRNESLYPEKDKIAYENIEKNSSPVTAVPEAEITNTVTDQGITMSVTDAYCDGFDLYFTFALETEDAELNTADMIDLLIYRENDPIPFYANLMINGEEAYTHTGLSPKKSEDGLFVMLARVSSYSLQSGEFPANMTVELNSNALAARKMNIPETEDMRWTGFKSTKGSWKLKFQPTMDISQNKTMELNAQSNGCVVQKATQTPSNMHVNVYLPAEYAVKNPALLLTDTNGNKIQVESSQDIKQENGNTIRRAVFNQTDSSQFTLKIIDKNAGTDENGNFIILAEIPFSMN